MDRAGLRGVETLLVLEDQAEVRALIEKRLRGYGYSAMVAANGPEALAAVRACDGPTHLMLADVVVGSRSAEIAHIARLLGCPPRRFHNPRADRIMVTPPSPRSALFHSGARFASIRQSRCVSSSQLGRVRNLRT